MSSDFSNGYEACAAEFLVIRQKSRMGAGLIQRWARDLAPGGAVLDLGCGGGEPVATELVGAGHEVFGIDASPAMIRAFRAAFPQAEARCEPLERSDFFARTFHAAVACGVLFLLSPEIQTLVIERVAGVLVPRGRFLFTAPRPQCTWRDVLTGLESTSLGASAYERILAANGLRVVNSFLDEGANHYFDARRA